MSSIELGTIKIPGWLPGAADLLIGQAEEFLGEADGKTRKQWVMDTLKTLARAHDIEGVPDWIERPLEDAVISLVVETIFAFKFKRITEEERIYRQLNRQKKRTERKKIRSAKRASRKAQQEAKES
tara:strand:- start:691 stop:1068 length:378 start_codon:yes stop_codon:yes gene_type:complete